jgi:addiction module RelB/DinJ family antitoxin
LRGFKYGSSSCRQRGKSWVDKYLTNGITLTILCNIMNYAVITAKIDPQDKREAQLIAEELGLSLSAVVKAMLKQFVRSKRLEVGVRSEIPNEYLQSVMKQARKNREAGKGSPVFDNIEDNLKWLEKQGI